MLYSGDFEQLELQPKFLLAILENIQKIVPAIAAYEQICGDFSILSPQTPFYHFKGGVLWRFWTILEVKSKSLREILNLTTQTQTNVLILPAICKEIEW